MKVDPTGLREIPSVSDVLALDVVAGAVGRFGRTAVVAAVRDSLDAVRAARCTGHAGSAVVADIAAAVLNRLEGEARPNVRPVFNLTGTILHTNLGRALLAEAAVEAAATAMRQAIALEFDLTSGRRGERDALIRGLLRDLTGAEDATIVNNNAAAVLLVLNTFAKGREAVVSRGELIEIGGAFRLPDIMTRAGAKLVEVGTTNRTHAMDYIGSIGPKTGVVLKVHTSNYRIEGFTAEVGIRELATIAQERGVPLAHDLGSGTLVDLSRYGVPYEPTVAQTVAQGADLVTFSGDKLLGGPQAGFIVGRKDLIARINRNPLKRALRVDKIRLAALEATLRLYRDPDRLADRLPTLRLIARPQKDVAALARRLVPVVAAAVGEEFEAEVVACSSQIGSGALPQETIPSAGIAIRPRTARGAGGALASLAAALRRLSVPVIGRIADQALLLDLRCLEDEAQFTSNLAAGGVAGRSGDREGRPPEVAGMIIGTAGHIDHGKTSVVRALTGIDTDRLKEEKIRGISIDLGFAYAATPEGDTIGFVDVPGHERFVHTMLAGATGIDFVLLIVAADDGVMPQTTEHLAIIDLLGIERGIVVLSKVDLVSSERLEQVTAEIRAVVSATGIAGAEIVPVSAVTGLGIEQLRERLFAAARALGRRARRGRFRLAVDRSFTLAGVGTVVTGTVLSGAVAVGDHVLVSPSGRAARVRSIHAQNQPAERGHAGDRCALNLAGEGISKAAVGRGDVVLDPALHAPSDRIDALLRVMPSEPRAIAQWTPVRLHHAATEVGARIVQLGDGPIAPGTEAFVQLVLEKPIAAAAGDRFVVRDTSAQRTIGGGILLDLRAPARKRRTPERMAQLQAHALGDAQAAIVALLDRPPGYVDLAGFGRDRTLSVDEVETIVLATQIVRIVSADSEWGMAQATWTRIRGRIAEMLRAFHAENPDLPGMGSRQLQMLIDPKLPPALFAAALNVLARAGEISLSGAWVRLPTHEIRLTARDEGIWLKIAPHLGGEHRFRPPRIRDIARALSVPEADVRRIMKLLSRRGEVYEIAQDHFFTRAAVAEIVDALCTLAETGEGGAFTVAQLRDRLENGRKVAMQILEFFDRHRVTARHGELRRLDARRLDLFRAREEPPSGVGASGSGGESSPVGRPDFKSGRGREPVFGGFDSHSLPPTRFR